MNFSDFLSRDNKKNNLKKLEPVQEDLYESEEFEDQDEYEDLEEEVEEIDEELDEEYEQRMLEDRRRQKMNRHPVVEEKRIVVQQPVEKKIIYVDQYGNEIKNFKPAEKPEPIIEKRVVQRPVQKPVQRPIQKQIVRPVEKKLTIEGTAAQNIDSLKKKIESIFFRFGIQGLERLDEKLQDVIDELMYPDYRDNYERNKKTKNKKDLREMRRIPSRKIVKKVVHKPIEVAEPVYEEPVEEIQQIIEEPQQVIEQPIETKPEIKIKRKEIQEMSDVEAALDIFNNPVETEEESEEEMIENNEMDDLASQILEGVNSMNPPIQQQLNAPNVGPRMIEMPEIKEEQVEEQVEQIEEQVEPEPKPVKRRKKKVEPETVIEENTTNEEE